MSNLPERLSQRSIWTVLAAAILMILALLSGAAGVLLLNEVVIRGHVPGGSGGVFEVFVGLGVGLALVAALHLWATASAWRGRYTTARLVGWAGVLLGGVAFGLCLVGARDVAVLVLLFPLAYGAILLCLRASNRDSDGSAAADSASPGAA